MINSFYVDKEMFGEYLTQQDINELNSTFKTDDPIITNDLERASGGLTPEQIVIEVGICLISALAYDALKKFFCSLAARVKKNAKKRYNKYYRKFGEPYDPYPDMVFKIDVNNADINLSFEINCNSEGEVISEKARQIKAITDSICQTMKAADDKHVNAVSENDKDEIK